MAGYYTEVKIPNMNTTPKGLMESPRGNWEIFRGEGSILGPIEGTNWFGVFTLAQAVGDGGVHFMVSPQREHFDSINYLSVKDLSTATGFMRVFLLNNDGAFAGINVSEDKPDRRALPQRYANFHAHLIVPDKSEFVQVFVPSSRNREPLLLGKVLDELFDGNLGVLGIDQIGSSKGTHLVGDIGGLVRSSLLFYVDFDKVSGVDLAQAIKELDNRYRDLHAKVFGALAINYSDVIWDEWKTPFIRRGGQELNDKLGDLGLGDKTRDELRHFISNIKEEDAVQENLKVYRSPAYSLVLYADNGNCVMAFSPHIFRQGGIMESYGVEIQKVTTEGTDINIRRGNAQRSFERTLDLL